MSGWLQHFPILPIVIPLLAGAGLLLLDDAHRRGRAAVALTAGVMQLAVALTLMYAVAGAGGASPSGIEVYRLGGWSAPFGIVLVVDRLSALMLTLCAVLGLASLVYALARWDRAGVHYHPLFQFILMGLNGAFLTGDIFNLFVFFEVLLAASYGLALHGSGADRVRAGLAYIVVNLAASLLFLIGAALIYGITGTLNMADLAYRVPALSADDRALFSAGIALLVLVFLVKAAAWPLNFWLPSTYSAASAPVAAMFSIMTKVGVYALLRIGSVLEPIGGFASLGGGVFVVGILTLTYSAIGVLGVQKLDRVAGYSVIASSGTLLAAFGLGMNDVTAPMLFYLTSSVLVMGAFYLVIEMTERSKPYGADLLAVTIEAFGMETPEEAAMSEDVVGFAIPRAMAFIGMAFFTCTVIIAGLPPLSSFVAKFALLVAAFGAAEGTAVPVTVWLLMAAILVSGLTAMITLSRLGMRIFWSSEARTTPRLPVTEAAPAAVLICLCIALAVAANPAMEYMRATAGALHDPTLYIEAVMTSARGAGQ
ncbi:monovalent cation/H+ antiporter subunit D [Thauera sinica]|uniref:Monovalent cation/H+ antiporter subunit D n=1 Tax=Thauera sinica TaxID=2665146 RepID=A0ABW1AYL0_9RHOO|nr:monovalent cation/H+ antiporter subunit D [Thauera sp. K11]ATE58918.1 monovalent cation/H+ antiporter subunit D [Thauera sp. K11]